MSGAVVTVGELVEALNAVTGIKGTTRLWVLVGGRFFQVTELRVDEDADLIIEGGN